MNENLVQIIDQSHPTKPETKAQAQAAIENVLKRQDIGFFQIPGRADLWSEIQSQAQKLHTMADDLVIVGIGGSSLGPKALNEFFINPQSAKRIHFCDNVDAMDFEKVLRTLRDWDRTVWVFISKSGSTIETLVTADLVFQKYSLAKKTPKAIVVSEKRSNPLVDWAQKNKIDCLEIPLDVGGRFSVLTAVGMLPMGFLGMDIQQFRQGSALAVKKTEVISELMAQIAQSFSRQEWISFLWFYSSSYLHFGRWLQQLWAESLAKTKNLQGEAASRVSTPIFAIGAIDQHSLLQQVMEGAKDKLVIFARFKETESAGDPVLKSQFSSLQFFEGHTMGQLISAQAKGTRMALNDNGVSTLTLQFAGSSSQDLGFQLMFWQLVVAGLGQMLNINAYDQPGVELGKRLAKQILKS